MGRDGPEVQPEKVHVVSITVNGKYRVDATINKEHMLQRIHTWVPDPVLGDMNYEHEFTNASYVDIGDGVSERDGRSQCLRRDDEGHQGERLPGSGDRSGLGSERDIPRPRGVAEARRRRLPDGRIVSQQRRGRIQGLHRRSTSIMPQACAPTCTSAPPSSRTGRTSISTTETS
jgi:hypothetical protein